MHSKSGNICSEKTDLGALTFRKECTIQTEYPDMNKSDVGLGLGSQVSQVLSLLAASPIDHLIKDKYRVKGYIRYMDDGIIFHEDKEFLVFLLKEIEKKATELGLKLNMKKTKIIKIEDGFSFLKKKFSIDKNGKINVRIARESVTRMRRKLKKFRTMYEEGKMSYKDIYISYQSWKSFSSQFDSYQTIKNMDRLFDDLFIKPFIEGSDYEYVL